jgi:large subunit ribosomal protein L17
MGDRSFIPHEHREDYASMSDAKRLQTKVARSGRRYRTGAAKGRLTFTAQSVTHKLVNDIAPKFSDRPGGYIRLIRLGDRRIGDQAALALLQLVGDEEAPTGVTRPAKTARRKRADARYAFAVKTAKAAGKQKRGKSAAQDQPKADQAQTEES